jgi:hypothetical protein
MSRYAHTRKRRQTSTVAVPRPLNFVPPHAQVAPVEACVPAFLQVKGLCLLWSIYVRACHLLAVRSAMRHFGKLLLMKCCTPWAADRGV